jgi:ABC-type transporter Mla subunit MlaD
MAENRNAFVAGLFIVASIGIAGFIVVGIKGTLRVAEPIEDRQVTFKLSDNLSGLGKGDDLRLGGLKVGIVRSINVVTDGTPDGEPRIVVSFSMPERYKLHANAIVMTDSSLTGVPYLNIERLGNGPETNQVDGQPSTITKVADILRTAAPEAAAVVHDVGNVTVPKLNGAVENTGEAMAQIRDLVGDSKLDIRGTLASLHASMDGIREKLPGILDEVQVDLQKVQGTVDHAQTALSDLTTSLANAKDITASARSLLVTNRGRIDNIVAGLKTTSDNLKGASVEIRQSPWRLLYKPTPDEMGNLNLFDSARQFADGASSLNDAAVALRDSLQDKNTDAATVRKLMAKLDDSFANFKLVENKLWTDVK